MKKEQTTFTAKAIAEDILDRPDLIEELAGLENHYKYYLAIEVFPDGHIRSYLAGGKPSSYGGKDLDIQFRNAHKLKGAGVEEIIELLGLKDVSFERVVFTDHCWAEDWDDDFKCKI